MIRMENIQAERAKKRAITFFTTKPLVDSQIWFNWICSLFRLLESVNAFIILFPSYGLVLGLLFGISSYYLNNKVNDMSLMLHDEVKESNFSGKSKVSILEKLAISFTGVCRFMANVLGVYAIYQIYGEKIHISKNVSQISGWYFGVVIALTDAVFSMFVIADYWRQNTGEKMGDFQNTNIWKSNVVVLKVLRTLAAVVENTVVYYLLIPGPYGFIIGLSFGVCFAVLNMVKSIAILFREAYVDNGEVSYQDTWQTNLFIFITLAFTVISGVNNFINSYISLNLLCMAAFAVVNPSILFFFSVTYGVSHFISSTLYWGAFSEQMWNNIRKKPEAVQPLSLAIFPINAYEEVPLVAGYKQGLALHGPNNAEFDFSEEGLNVCNK